MSIGKSIFDVIEHLFYGGNFTHPNRPGWVKRQYFRFSTRSSGEKLTIFVNLCDNTDLDAAYQKIQRCFCIRHRHHQSLKEASQSYRQIAQDPYSFMVPKSKRRTKQRHPVTNIIVWPCHV